MSEHTKNLIALYHKKAIEAGFNCDKEVVEAWSQNPIKYSELFSLRMNIISIINTYL